ncbi:TIGR03088 family PEP-CTERM/XrtA system glycosyltransferase [Ferrovum sp.]|uniref:TIGR03088 family PEP-CTERM/XrtA system glycosyltransferase n=1 Tax=Ferrovum sp. TaxID=2609467 RepID=UPI002634EBB4|nr:TIGR03088 family PEP-CTERM/XrtA system glycosyltransferase [Ferrovum sp.]
MMPPDSRPLIAHIIYRLDVGGLENGLVNLINHLPADQFRHAILCLKGHDPAFARRIQRRDVLLIDLEKKEGKDLGVYGRLWRHFRQLKPAIVHTRNLTSLVAVVPALLAGVPYRIHGEHGRDMSDLDGANQKHQWFRRMLLPLTHRVIVLSQDLERYLIQVIGVPRRKVSQFYNGVDTELFHPREDGEPSPFPAFFSSDEIFVIGTVGRMQAVKNPLLLAQAFITLVETAPKELAGSLRLIMIGEGPLRQPCQALLDRAGLTERVWLPGARHDIPILLRHLDLFVLPSLAEGISNTLLEAMASGVPVIATQVGGNPELVTPGIDGSLIPSNDVPALVHALLGYLLDRPTLIQQRNHARHTALERFSLIAMVDRYKEIYQNTADQ